MALRSSVPLEAHDPDIRPSGLPMADSEVLFLDGSVLPGALLPSEIFMSLVARVYTPDNAARDEMRREILARSSDPQLNRRDLWSRLASAAAPYLALDAQRERVMAEAVAVPEADRPAIYARLPSLEEYCRQGALALDAARREFGREAFDRFLYEAVAPDVEIGTTLTPAELRIIEDGCLESTPGIP